MLQRTATGMNAQMSLDIIHTIMEEIITEEQARQISAVWKRDGIYTAYALLQSVLCNGNAGKGGKGWLPIAKFKQAFGRMVLFWI